LIFGDAFFFAQILTPKIAEIDRLKILSSKVDKKCTVASLLEVIGTSWAYVGYSEAFGEARFCVHECQK